MQIPTDVLNTVDQVMALAKRHESIVKLAEALKQIGSLDQAARETETRLERLRQEQVTEQVKVAELQQQSMHMLGSLDAQKDEARQHATTILKEAEAAAETIKLSADSRAAAMLDAAQKQAAEMKRNLDAATAEHKATVAALRAEAAEIGRAIPAAQAMLADIEGKIAQAREQARRLLS